MQNATQPTYVLTDEKLKKVAKGVKKRLNDSLPKEHALSHQSILQVLSQELFSMSYEEAKSTILSKGIRLVDKGEDIVPCPITPIVIGDHMDTHGDSFDFYINDYCEFQESIEIMKWIIPLNEVSELKPHLELIYGKDCHLLLSKNSGVNGIESGPQALKSMESLSRLWEEDEMLFGLCMMVLHYYASQGADEFTLSRMREVLTLGQAIKWTGSASLPADIKLMLARTLHKEGVVKDGQVHFGSVIRFERSVKKQARKLDVMYEYINSKDGRKRLLSADSDTSMYKGELAVKTPAREIALLDAITSLAPFIPLHTMVDLESISEQIERATKGRDDVVSMVRHQNALRKKEMSSVWHNRSYGLIRIYTDAYLCSLGRTMQGPRFFDLVAGFNLDNLAAMSKDKELPFELRSGIKSALTGLTYAWDRKEQSASTMENFAHVVMQVGESFDAIKSYILDSIE
jgi:hypothetical protein